MQRQAAHRFDQITDALRRLPRPVLLVIRNMNLIRAITSEHGSGVDRYRLMARSATQGAFHVRGGGLANVAAGYWQRLVFDWKLFVDALKMWALRQTVRVLTLLGRVPPEMSKLTDQL